MPSKSGRNDPCPCGSGQKYKRCCLPREEAERAEAVKQQRLWEEDAELDDEVNDEYDEDELIEDVPPFDRATVRAVRYARGFVETLDAVPADALRVAEWRAPSIPPGVLDCLEREAIDELAGQWGDADAAHPIQVDIVEVLTDDGLIEMEVLNRGILLAFENDEDTRRVHRICVALDRAAEDRGAEAASAGGGAHEEDDAVGRRSDDGAEPGTADIDVDTLLKTHRRQPGLCALCGATLTSSGAAKHVAACAAAHDQAPGAEQTLVHLRVTAPGCPGYWLELEMRDDAKLDALDRFLRDIWLECCGHLSQFTIGPVDFVSTLPPAGSGASFGASRTERSMRIRLAEVLPLAGSHFSYEYDFGSTTALQIDVKGTRMGRIGRKALRLLARNTPPEWPCGVCAESSAFIDMEDDEYPFRCAAHADDDGEARLLPVVNSPRAGVCAYGG
jgi:hypothetical protein